MSITTSQFANLPTDAAADYVSSILHRILRDDMPDDTKRSFGSEVQTSQIHLS